MVFVVSMALPHSFPVTLTRGPYNISSLFLSERSTFQFPFASIITHSRNFVVWTATHFHSLSKWNYTTFFCANVTQVSCKVSLTSTWTIRGTVLLFFVCLSHNVLLFPFKSFMTHSNFYDYWPATEDVDARLV